MVLKRRKSVFFFSLLIILCLTTFFIYRFNKETFVIGKIVDAGGGGPVYGVQINISNRSTVRYSDAKYKITGLSPGKYTIIAKAPNYRKLKKSVIISSGSNTINLRMRGEKIAGLSGFIAFFEVIEKEGLLISIRLVDSTGEAIEHYPKLPMEAFAEIFTLTNQDPPKKVLFSGPLELSIYNESKFDKLRAFISKDKIKVTAKDKVANASLILKTGQGIFTDSRENISLLF